MDKAKTSQDSQTDENSGAGKKETPKKKGKESIRRLKAVGGVMIDP